MGVPAFFRWLTGNKKYPSIVVYCVEEKAKEVDGVKAPVDGSKPNPNDTEFDNLYLDMNGIIHPCCHPEDKPAPKNEDEMMVLIFEYIDRIFNIVRPRKLLYMAIDGVAPRAKMNQQRSRRFRSSKETREKTIELGDLRAEFNAKGYLLPPEKPLSEKFDSNCITPGTPFMFKLADCLRYYVHDRLTNDPGWKDVKVILSDANVPGEGEHKIMDYIRRQRGQPDHDPNTHHCLCGADADLIMLGLSTHEPNFTIVREEFISNKPKPCELCSQFGHEVKECTGLPKDQEEMPKAVGQEVQFIFLRLCILREYLEKELMMDNLPFKYEFERALDDWVLMCFFVGNDFLPHLPSLEIREGAIDRLQRLYKDTVRKTGGYLSDSGVVNLTRVQLILTELGKVEDEIFKKRRETELNFRRRDKDRKARMKRLSDGPKWIPGSLPAQKISEKPSVVNVREMKTESAAARIKSNEEAAASLKSMLNEDGGSTSSRGEKRKHEEGEEEEEQEPPDNVRLWEDGWKDRYYEKKFDMDGDDMEFRQSVANHYVIGMCWVLRYYYQGCPSWKWYFPFHYAPFASDFVNIGDLPNDFEFGTQPFNPLEQLMGVFPAASKEHLPITWRELMTSPDSPILDFYPEDFRIDLNGKKFAWQGVALLPFVDEKRLLGALETVYPDLTQDELKRNTRGSDRLFVGAKHPAFDFIEGLYEGSEQNGESGKNEVEINTKLTQGMKGTVCTDEFAIPTDGTFPSPLPECTDLNNCRVMSCKIKDPQYPEDHLHKCHVLPGAKFPPKVLKPEDFMGGNPRGGYRGGRGGRGGGGYNNDRWRPQLGFQRQSGYRDQGSKDVSSAQRMIRGAQTFPGCAYPPPQSLQGDTFRGSRGSGGRGFGGGYGQGGGGGHDRDPGYWSERGKDRGFGPDRSYNSRGSQHQNSMQWSRHMGGGGASDRGGYNQGGGSGRGNYSQGNDRRGYPPPSQQQNQQRGRYRPY